MNRTMKNSLTLVTIYSTAFVSAICAQDAAIPEDSGALLRQLAAFEKSELEKAHSNIREKRRLVAENLKSHLERETKAGKLEQALAIKKEIEELNSQTETAHTPKEIPQEAPTNVAGTVWKNGNWTYQFLVNGNVQIQTPTGSDQLKWSQENITVTIQMSSGKEFATWRISRDGVNAKVTSGSGDGSEPRRQKSP